MSPLKTSWSSRVGVVLSGIAVLFLVFDSLGKLLAVRAVLEGAQSLVLRRADLKHALLGPSPRRTAIVVSAAPGQGHPA